MHSAFPSVLWLLLWSLSSRSHIASEPKSAIQVFLPTAFTVLLTTKRKIHRRKKTHMGVEWIFIFLIARKTREIRHKFQKQIIEILRRFTNFEANLKVQWTFCPFLQQLLFLLRAKYVVNDRHTISPSTTFTPQMGCHPLWEKGLEVIQRNS